MEINGVKVPEPMREMPDTERGEMKNCGNCAYYTPLMASLGLSLGSCNANVPDCVPACEAVKMAPHEGRK